MWGITTIRQALQIACEIAKAKDDEKAREKLVELGMKLWDMIDPTPDIQLDDKIVEAIIRWAVDWMLEEMKA